MSKKLKNEIGTCPDCGRDEVEITSQGICTKCRTRKANAKVRGKTYIPYIDLPESKKQKIDNLQQAQVIRKEQKMESEKTREIPAPTIQEPIENYYEVKATKNKAVAQVVDISTHNTTTKTLNDVSSSDKKDFITTLRDCGCEIPEVTLDAVLDVLMATDQLKNIFMTIARNDSQQAILDLEQALNVIERKLQHTWEYNGFQEADERKFKNFLTWRRTLKGAIFFWKKLYQTNTIIEMQRVWNSYTSNPNDKTLMTGDRIDSTLKRFQITTESISTIFNTRRPFTRVFYANTETEAYEKFVAWMADRQLHENKAKTVITELKSEGETIKK